MTRVSRLALVAGILLLAGACAHHAGKPADVTRLQPPAVDSVTIALWHMDETGGTRVADSGPYRLEGTAGVDTRTGYGQFGQARSFEPSLDSFVFVPHSSFFDFEGSFTIEAWVYVEAFGYYEVTPILSRWSPLPNEQSWLFGITGFHQPGVPIGAVSAAGLDLLGLGGEAGLLMFAFQPEEAAMPIAFSSARALTLRRWTHVAATYDGEVVRLYVDGQLDAQFATRGRVRPSPAPLLVGNLFDERWLGRFSGDLRVEQALDPTPYFAFQGMLDEVRISSGARPAFPWAEWR